MFTSQAPLLLSALNGAMSDDNARQLTQVFANCNQALTHRGSVNLQNTPMYQKNGVITQQSGDGIPPWGLSNQAANGQAFPFGGQSGSFYGGNYYGVDGPSNALQLAYQPGNSSWANYVNVNPTYYTGGSPFVFPNPPGGYQGGDWITYMGDTNTFDLAPRITENTSQYYGGPTFQVAGDSVFDNSVTNNSYITNLTTQNITVEEVNGQPARGDQGDPGLAGPAGADGKPGNPGLAGPAGAVGGGGGGNAPINQFITNFFGNGVGGGGGGGGFLVGPPGAPGAPGAAGRVDPVFQAAFGVLNTAFWKLKADYEIFRRRLKNLTFCAKLTDACKIEITTDHPNIFGICASNKP